MGVEVVGDQEIQEKLGYKGFAKIIDRRQPRRFNGRGFEISSNIEALE